MWAGHMSTQAPVSWSINWCENTCLTGLRGGSKGKLGFSISLGDSLIRGNIFMDPLMLI